MKHKILFSLLILNLVVAAGCRSKLDQKADPQVRREFGVNISDVEVKIKPELYSSEFRSVINQNQVTVSSYQLLSLANSFLESGKPEWKKAAMSLASITQKAGVTATVMNTDVAGSGNPYAEQAYQFVKPALLSQYTKVLVKAQTKVEEAASKINPPVAEALGREKVSQAQIHLQNILDQLNDFNSKLTARSDDEVAAFIKPIVETVNKEYIKPLSDFYPNLTWKKSQRLDLYLADLQSNVLRLPGLSEEDKKTSAAMLNEAIEYGRMAENINDVDGGISLVIDMWMCRPKRAKMPREMVESFRALSEKTVLAIATDNKPLIEDTKVWEDISSKIKTQFENEHEKEKAKGKVKDFSTFTDDQLLSYYTSNKALLSDSDWQKVSADRIRKNLLSFKSVNELALSLGAKPTDDLDKFKKLAIYWMSLRFRFDSYPDSLFNSLKLSTEEDLEAFKVGSWTLAKTALTLVPARLGLKSFITKYHDGETEPANDAEGIKNYRSMMINKIYSTVDKVLKDKIQALSLNLRNIIKTEVISKLEKQKEVFSKLVFEQFETMAKKYLKGWFFESTEQLPLIESSTLNFSRNALAIWSAKGELKETSSHVLGAGILYNNLAIKSFPFVAPETTEDKNSWTVDERKFISFQAFHAFSKLSSIAGYIDYNMRPTDALTIPIIAPDASARFDLFKIQSYDPMVATFAVSDKTYLQNQYKSDVLKTKSSAVVSVTGQMDLLRGCVASMKLTKPWEVGHFDYSLKLLKVKEFEKVPGIKDIFSKPDLFKQSLGLALGILKNVQSRMVGVINAKGEYVPNAAAADKRSAVVVDFTAQKMATTAITKDIAQAIIALTDFYISTSDIAKTEDPELVSGLPLILGAREQIKILISGLSLFSTGKLMQSDGGFVRGFNLETMKPLTGRRSLEDQLFMQKALMISGNLLNLDLLRTRVVDNLFFMNQKFWSEEIGFYKDTEEVKGTHYQIRNVVLALESTEMVLNFLSEFVKTYPQLQASMNQIKTLRSYWESRLLSKEVLSQDSVELIYPHAVLNSQKSFAR